MHGADSKRKQAREKCVAIHLNLLQFLLAWLLIGWKGGRGLLPNMSSDWTRRLSNSHQSWPMDRRMTAGQMNSHISDQSPYGKQINERC